MQVVIPLHHITVINHQVVVVVQVPLVQMQLPQQYQVMVVQE